MVRPVGWDARNGLVADVILLVRQVVDVVEGGVPRSQLVGKAAEGPNVDLLGVANALDDLGRHPVCSSFLGLPVLLLLREED